MSFDHVWHWYARLPERKGLRCRIRCRGSMNSVAVEFQDGALFCVSRHAVRPHVETPQLSMFRRNNHVRCLREERVWPVR